MNEQPRNAQSSGERPLYGKVALVTGGSRGIGASTAVRLAEDGADVALTYTVGEQPALEVADRIKELGGRARTVRADASDAAEIQAAVDGTVDELGRLDIVVNNAGVGIMGIPIEEMTLEDIDTTLSVNVRGVYLTSRAAVPHLAENGRVVSVSSCLGERVPWAGMSAYAMSKLAVTGLTRALARELGPRGITVNQVAPGPIDTDANPADSESADRQRQQTALGRYGTARDVADSVAYLAGESGRFISGASIAVDGGFNA